ncbi:MAG TPA: DUF6600 domain-containing protein [Thermoanaerobaculia bacterium]
MRRKHLSALLLPLLLLVFVPAGPASAAVSVSFSYFHDSLAPHGRWVSVGSYGDCWYPGSVAAGWQPYTVGEWIYTDYGWTWVSADPWGDIPYHYGTWIVADAYGWVWIPGFVWAPAWVTWSYSDSYVGWAPIPPSMELSMSGYFGPPVVVSQRSYVFVPVNRFVGTRVATVRVDPRQNGTILASGRRVTKFAASGGIIRNEGPPVRTIERAGVRVQKTSLRGTPPTPITAATAAVHGRKLAVIAPPQAKARVAGKAGESPRAESRKTAESKKATESGKSAESRKRAESGKAVESRAPAKTGAETKKGGEGKKAQTHKAEPRKPKQPAHTAPAGEPPKKPEAQAKRKTASGSERPAASAESRSASQGKSRPVRENRSAESKKAVRPAPEKHSQPPAATARKESAPHERVAGEQSPPKAVSNPPERPSEPRVGQKPPKPAEPRVAQKAQKPKKEKPKEPPSKE